MESVCIVTSNKLRIEKERKLLIEMVKLQRNCIMNCFKGEGNVNEWMDTNFSWFTCLELDINDLNKVIDDKNENQEILEIGKLWIRWGCVQMKLFNLCEKLDPQSQLFWENKYLNEEIQDLLKLKNISSMYRGFLSGITKENGESEECWSANGLEHPFLNATWNRLKDLTEIFHNQKSYGLRPVSDEKYIELKSRIMRFLSVYGWTSLCDDGESTMRKVSNFDSGFLNEWSVMSGELLDYFLSSSDRFVFPDLIEPLALGIGRVLVGLDLLHKSKMMVYEDDERTKCATKICEIFCQFPNCNSLDLVERILKEEKIIMYYCSVLIGDSKAKIMAKIHIRLLNLSLRLLSLPNNNRVRTVYLLHNLIRTFNALWNKQEKKRLKKEETEASSYLKKQSITSTLNEEELETVNIYLEVCPSMKNENGNRYFDEKSMEMSSTMNLAISKIQRLREHLEKLECDLLLSEDTVHSIVMLIDKILNNKSSLLLPEEEIEAKQLSRKVFQDCYQFAATLICSNSKNIVDSEKMCLFPMHISALIWEYDSLSTAVSVEKNKMSYEKPYDIYQDPVRICNIINVQSILEESQKSVKKLLNEYPENVTLLRIEKNINTILNLSLDNSLISFKTSVESLVHEIQQWEIVAARHLSLISHVEKLNKLLSLWSHEELKMWGNIFDTASWKLKRSVSTEFFKIISNLLNETGKIEKQCENFEDDFQSSINTILEPIMFSVTNSNIGSFKSKLVIVRLIIDYLNSMSEFHKNERIENTKIRKDRFLDKLKFVLKNHLDYYLLYQSNVDNHLVIEHKKIETELKNFIKAKKWGDAPPKSTDLAKCLKTVFKYLRQWNDIINKPVNTFMTLNPINGLKNVFIQKFQDCSLLSSWCEEMLHFCRNMWDAMNRLRKETTDLEVKASEHVKNSSINKKVFDSLKKVWFTNVDNLQQRKRDFATTFVKQLKDEVGLNLLYTRFPRHTTIMTHLPLGDVEMNISTKNEKKGVASTDMEKLSAIRCISLRLQLDELDKSEEFVKFNILKDHLIGACDHLLSITCNSSITINRWRTESENVHMMIKYLSRTLKFECRFPIDPRFIEQELESMNFDYMEKLGEWLTFIGLCSESIIEISNSKTLPFIINDDNLKPKLLLRSSSNLAACRMISISINNIIEEIQKNKVPQCFVVTQEHLDCLNRQKGIITLIEILTEDIKRQFSPEWIEINSTITIPFEELNRKNLAVIEKLESSLYKQQSALTIMDKTQHQSLTFKELKELIDDVNERFGKLNEAILYDKVDNGKNIDLSIIKIIGLLGKMESKIEIATIRKKLNQIIEGLKWISDPLIFDEMRREINQNLLPNLSGMLTMIDEFSLSLINIHNVLLGATDSLISITSLLMSEEFCTPNESIWDKNEDDGEWNEMNDFSDQIESESQIECTNNHDDQDKDVEYKEYDIEMIEDFDVKWSDNKWSDNKKENEKKNEYDNEKDDEMKYLEDKMGEVCESPETYVYKESWGKENHDEERKENKVEVKTNLEENEDKRKGGMSSKDDNEMVANDEEKEEEQNHEKETEVLVDEKQKSEEMLKWLKINSGIQFLIGDLCENLRTVLQSTKANMLGGAFSSGKRINMKKLVHILASGDDSKNNFWMRRIRSRQREYQVIISADNSVSMTRNVSVQVFFESLAIVLEGLNMLKVGQVGVCKFGDKAEVVVPLHEQFNSEIGADLIKKFDFTDRCSKFVPMLEQSLQLFDENRYRNSSSTSQLLIILSDGGLSESVSDQKLVGLIRQALNKGIMVVVVILDHPDPKKSIVNRRMVDYLGTDNGRFLDHFPFQHFIVLQNVIKLPIFLCDAFRHWFALSSGGDRGSSR